jgi:coenzyme F420-0:L-glutamate ligase / coenzyme F420-1:gamma-L-glutamate ligase
MKGIMTSTTEALRDLILSRRSIRAFRGEPVPRETVRALLEDVQWSPSPHNSQPWRFTVLFNRRDKQGLADAMASRLAEELRADGVSDEKIERQTFRSRDRISRAPVVILCSLEQDGLVEYPDQRRNRLEWEMAVQSVGAALQTLFLLAQEQGIGSCWMAAPMYCPEVVREVLSLPDTYAPQALALLGYPENPGKVRPRRPFDTVVDFR